MKKTLILAVLIWSASLNAQTVFQGRAQAGVQDYDFNLSNVSVIDPASIVGSRTGPQIVDDILIDFSYQSPGQDEEENPEENQPASDLLPMLGVGGTIIFENGIYLDAYYQTSLDGSQDAFRQLPVTDFPENNFRDFQSVEIDKEDFALSIGKSFGQFTLTGGYKGGKTEFSQNFTTFQFSDAPDGVGAFANSSFELDGPFIGASYTLNLGASNLAFSVAVADLTGEFGSGFSNVREDLVTTSLEGDATGTTFGIKWLKNFGDKWSLVVGADFYEYDFRVEGAFERINEVGGTARAQVEADIDEDLFALRFDFKYTF